MLLVRRLKGLIPSQMNHPHQAQFHDSCCANAHPQSRDRTEGGGGGGQLPVKAKYTRASPFIG